MKTQKQPSRLLASIYETASDFHSIGVFSDEQMRKYETIAPASVIHLDKDVLDFFSKKCTANPEQLQIIINDLLRKNIENEQVY